VELIIRQSISDLFLMVIFLYPAILLIGGILLTARFAQNNELSRRWALIPSILIIVFVTVFFLLVVYDSGGFLRFIFTGALVIVTGLSIVIAIVQGVRYRHSFERNTLALYLLSTFLVIISSGIGFLGSNVMIGQCENFHLKTGNIIVNSLENYYSDNKQYPNNLSELVPNYINRGSISTCYSLRLSQGNFSTPQFDGFHYKKCALGTTRLSIPEMGSGQFHIYDLSDKQWYTSGGDTLGIADTVIRCQNYE
jgi:hypothetical protein